MLDENDCLTFDRGTLHNNAGVYAVAQRSHIALKGEEHPCDADSRSVMYYLPRLYYLP